MVDLSYKNEGKSPKQTNFQNGFIWIIKGEKSRIRNAQYVGAFGNNNIKYHH